MLKSSTDKMCQSRWPQCLCEVSYLWPQQLQHLQPRSNLWWSQPNLQELRHRRTKGGRSVSTVIEMMLTLPILKMRNADAKVWRDNIANSRCADVKKWLPSTRFLWLTCPQRWNILLSHTFLTTVSPVLGNVTITPILKDDIPEDYDYSHFEYINKVFLSKSRTV